MTQIGGFIDSNRRPGVLGVHSLDCFSMAVPDLARAKSFYESFGLEVHPRPGGLGLFTGGNDHLWGYLCEGVRKKLHFLSFGAYPEDLDGFRQRLKATNVALLPPPPGVERDGLWFHDHDGQLVEIKIAEKTSPVRKSAFAMISAAPGQRGTISRREGQRTQPRRLAHLALFTRDVAKAVAFYRDVLGLRLSDSSDGMVAFMHGPHGSDHHMVAFAKSPGAGLHHCSWDVGSVQDIGLGAMQMAAKGFTAGWGLGRHVLGANYFHYVRDPWGSYAEYSADMDYIPADVDWEAADHPGEDSFYLWGPTPPDDFVRNYEVEI